MIKDRPIASALAICSALLLSLGLVVKFMGGLQSVNGVSFDEWMLLATAFGVLAIFASLEDL
jgi:hypothetical protein